MKNVRIYFLERGNCHIGEMLLHAAFRIPLMGSRAACFTLLTLACLGLTKHCQGQPTGVLQDRVVYYDAKYDVIFAQQIDEVTRYFTLQGFKLMDTAALKDWMQKKVQTGTSSGSVVLQISDVTPFALVEPWDKSSLMYRYCEDGGRYVAPSGTALYAFEGENDITIGRQGQETDPKHLYLTSVFGIRFVYDLAEKGWKLTEAGRSWGLPDGDWMRLLLEGKPPEDVTVIHVKSEDDKAAMMWLKNINPKKPNSGFLGMCVMLCAHEPLLEAIYRACVFNGTAIQSVPKVDWRNSTAEPEFGVRFSMKVGPVERRAYERGETIPLRVEIFGKGYRGEAATLRLCAGKDIAWEAKVPRKERRGVFISEALDTRDLRCGEYALECAVEGREPVRETLWICPARRLNTFPWFIYKDHRANPHRELLTLQYLRDHGLNVCIADLHELAPANPNATMSERLGRYLDLLLRENLSAMARPDALNLYADDDRKEEHVVLPDGQIKTFGPRKAMGWRGFRDGHLPEYRDRLRRMAAVLRESGSPAAVPIFHTNDDGSMLGEYDFNEITLDDFEKQTGVSRNSLPPVKHIDMGPYGNRTAFMPQVPPGIVDDDHPWLRFMRYHAGNYALINQAAMEGLQSGWPGCLVGDLGCMSGPMFISRGYYSPVFAKPFNMAGFYEYPYWCHHFPFSMEVARMGNRGKPVSVVCSASYTAWGRVFQREFIYRILAEAPQCIAFWNLDARKPELKDLEAESYETLKDVGARVASVGEFLKRAHPRRHKGALLFPLEQVCFKANDMHSAYAYMRTGLENFQRAGAKLDFLCTEEVMAGKAADYSVVFVNGVQWLTKGVKARLEEYIRTGGVVVTDAETTVPIDGAIKAEGAFATSDADLSKSPCVALCRKYVEQYLQPEIVTATSPDTVVNVVETGGVPLAWVIDVESEEEVKALSQAQGSDWTYGVPKYLKAREAAEPRVRKTFRVREGYTAYDLWSSREIPLKPAGKGWRQGEVTTQFYGATPVALYRDRINAVLPDARGSETLRGRACRFYFRLLSDRKSPVRGIVPVEVKVYQPDGKESWEYGCNGIIE
ncbi:MAG: hypothetical protein HY318_03955, partial [Armatimonadetes bacterium]|nr:hypothetical protein [Armatimonadota bacterium]